MSAMGDDQSPEIRRAPTGAGSGVVVLFHLLQPLAGHGLECGGDIDRRRYLIGRSSRYRVLAVGDQRALLIPPAARLGDADRWMSAIRDRLLPAGERVLEAPTWLDVGIGIDGEKEARSVE